MKKLISMLVVLAMLMAMVPAVYAAEATETTGYHEVTIAEAVELAAEASETKYLVRGTVTEVSNTTYGNMYIKDAEGNTLYIYGVYDVDGSNRYDAMNTKPQVGDEVLLLGALTTYNGTAQMKNARVQEQVVTNGEDVTLVLGNNELDAGHDWTPELTTGQFVATQSGTLYITIRAFYYGTEATFNDGLLSEPGWVQLKINGESVTGAQQTLEVAAGDVVTITLESVDGDTYHAWFNLSFDGFYEEPLGSAMNPVILKPNDCPTDTVTIPAGEEIWYHLDYSERGNQFSGDHILYVYGENAYILVNEYTGNVRRVDAVDGVVTYAVQMYDIRICNAGAEDAVFVLDCEVPLGVSSNPQEIVEGVHVINMIAGNSGYYFEGYAPADGTLTVTIDAVVDGFWNFYLQNEGDPDSYADNIYESLDSTSDRGNSVTIDVKQGDRISGTFRLMDQNYDSCDGTATFTFDYSGVTEEPPVDPPVNPPVEPPVEEAEELTLGYQTVEVGANGQAYTWTAEEDGLFILNMMSQNWAYTINGVTRTSADQVPVHMTIVEVNAGDVITLNIGTADGSEATVSFAASTYAVGAPIDIEFIWNETYSAAAINVDMPAGEYTFMMWSGAGMELTINGVVTEMTGDAWMDPIVFTANIEEAGVVAMELGYPVGSYYNPDELELGYNTVDIEEYSQMGYWYNYTATEDCLFVLNMLSDNWFYSPVIRRADGSGAYPTGHYSEEDVVVPMQILELKAGDVLTLQFGTSDYAAATVQFSANTYAVGAPIDIEFIWNETYSAAAINVDMPAGEYTFMMWSGAGMELTVNGVVTEMTGDGWMDPIVFTANVEEEGVVAMALGYPVGSYYNPEELELGEHAVDIEEYSQMGYWYNYTATEDCLFVLTMLSDNWFYSPVIRHADGSGAYPTGHYSEEDVVVPVQVLELKAGDVLTLQFGTSDYAAATVEFSAMTYAGTEEDPIMVAFNWDEDYTAATLNVDIPAGEFVFGTRGLAGTILTANGEEIPYVASGNLRNPDLFVLTNESEDNAVIELALSYPPVAPGTFDNPEVVEEGEYTVELEYGNYDGYYMIWTAEEDGVLTITVSAETYWYLMAFNMNSDDEGIDHWSDEVPDVNTFTIDVKAGDEVIIAVNVYDYEEGLGLAGEVTVELDFTAAGEVALLGDVNGDGNIDTTDAKLIMQYNLDLLGEDALDLAAADVNGDGNVDTTDAKLIMQFNLGLITEFTKN